MPPVSVSGVPLLRTYSQEFQTKFKTELPALRACCPTTNKFVVDSIKLRKKVKAAHEITEGRRDKAKATGLFGRFKGDK